MHSRYIVSIFALLLAPSLFAQGHVLVVDGSGGAPFTQIQAAVDAAQAGDIVLVKSGSYASFAIANKSISVVGDVGASVQVNGTVQVRNLAADRAVLLHHLRSFGTRSSSPNDGPGITLKNDAGSVRVQDCLAQGAAGETGLRSDGSGDVAINFTQALGGVGGPAVNWWGVTSGGGLLAGGTALALYHCDIEGGDGNLAMGSSPPACSGGTGGNALDSGTSGYLFCGGTFFRGGNGQPGNHCSGQGGSTCCAGGGGGDAIDIESGLQVLDLLDDVLMPGHFANGGFGSCNCGLVSFCNCDEGFSGMPMDWNTGDLISNQPGNCPVLAVNANPVRELSTLAFTVDSAPGDQVFLAVNTSTFFERQIGKGVRLVRPTHPNKYQILGPTDAQGHLQDGWDLPDLGAGVQSLVVHMQALVKHANGQLVWSNPVHLVMLDQAF